MLQTGVSKPPYILVIVLELALAFEAVFERCAEGVVGHLAVGLEYLLGYILPLLLEIILIGGLVL